MPTGPVKTFPAALRSLALPDGSKLIASANGAIYFSTDWGLTWITNTVFNGTILAASADAGSLIATATNNIWTSRSISPPELDIARKGQSMLLSWTIPSMEFLLQETSDLTSASWIPIAVPPVLNFTTLQYHVILLLQGNGRFYRLLQ